MADAACWEAGLNRPSYMAPPEGVSGGGEIKSPAVCKRSRAFRCLRQEARKKQGGLRMEVEKMVCTP